VSCPALAIAFWIALALAFLNCHVALARGQKDKIPIGFSQILLFFGFDIQVVASLFGKLIPTSSVTLKFAVLFISKKWASE
jgi:zinc transporter ZupT